MTIQNKQNYIREKCIAANPSIMDLVFGCEVRIKIGDDLYDSIGKVEYACGKCQKHKFYKNCSDDCYSEGRIDDAVSVLVDDEEEPKEYVLLQDGKDFEIIGRPIRLADVLLAIGRRSDTWNISGDGYFNILDVAQNWQRKASWNLRADSLSDQEPEIIDFIYELLI